MDEPKSLLRKTELMGERNLLDLAASINKKDPDRPREMNAPGAKESRDEEESLWHENLSLVRH